MTHLKPMEPTVSIVTVCYNSANTISNTLESVASQDYAHIQHIIVDGASSDSTLQVVGRYPHVKVVVSEKDDGIYDAMNKGVELATGTVVAMLNADDFYPHPGVVRRLVRHLTFAQTDTVFADVCFVDPKNLKRRKRYYSAKGWHPGKFVRGFMPPHPSFFAKRELFRMYGGFKTDYRIAADYELLIRFLKVHGASYSYLPEAVVHMRAGGVSNQGIRSRYTLNREIVRACAENGLSTNMFLLGLKYLTKVFEYWPAERGLYER